MKFFKYSTYIIAAIVALSSCKEVPPGVDFSPSTGSNDTIGISDTAGISAQKHNVLLEEITGVRCVNCPAGHTIAEQIAAAHAPGQVAIVAVHAGQYAIPYSFSSNDSLKTSEGVNIYDLLGGSSQFPCADINRVGAQNNKFISPANAWAGYVNNELQNTLPQVKIALIPLYNNATRQLNLGVRLYYTQSVPTTNNLSVMITENGIFDAQEVPVSVSPSGIDTFYNQRHVLRGMLTPFNGQSVNGTKAPGSSISITLNPFTIPANWNADSCNIIAFISQGTDSILQVVSSPLKK